eukprot:3894801-Prymnesium_polylepis.2
MQRVERRVGPRLRRPPEGGEQSEGAAGREEGCGERGGLQGERRAARKRGGPGGPLFRGAQGVQGLALGSWGPHRLPQLLAIFGRAPLLCVQFLIRHPAKGEGEGGGH